MVISANVGGKFENWLFFSLSRIAIRFSFVVARFIYLYIDRDSLFLPVLFDSLD